MESEPNKTFPTLEKRNQVEQEIIAKYFKGQNHEGTLDDAVNYANASMQDYMFNGNYYKDGQEITDDVIDEIQWWQRSLEHFLSGNVAAFKETLVHHAIEVLENGEGDEDLVILGTSLLNLAHSIEVK